MAKIQIEDMKTTTAPQTELQLKLEAIAADASKLASELIDQKSRLSNLATLEAKKQSAHTELECDSADYHACTAKLAEANQGIDAISWAASKRGEAILNASHQLRSRMAETKNELLGAISRAAGHIVALRQSEAAKLITSWSGGPAPERPLSIAAIMAACPVIRNLEGHRIALEQNKPNAGPATFLAVAKPAAATLAGMTVPDAEPLLYGGHVERTCAVLLGWDGINRRFDLVDVYPNQAESNRAFEALRGRSGFAGLAKVYRLTEATLDNETHFPAPEAGHGDRHENAGFHERWPLGSGTNEGFLSEVHGWATTPAAE